MPLVQTIATALMTLVLAKAETPVYAGACRLLECTPIQSNINHGRDGLGGIKRLSLDRSSESFSAYDYTLNHVPNEDWVIGLGPLTNLGEALRSGSERRKRIGGIAIMGGSTKIGNARSVAEFNSYTDPHAATKVFASRAKFKMCGLDLTHQLLINDSTVTTIRKFGTSQSTLVATLLNLLWGHIELSVGYKNCTIT